ncbi:hypothetical protein F441_05248 [Phytophthora nicotianae CJ01A1]|uniref:Heme haloperoxidase family profile domain-containing protein n=6 Tax=Phytophthora nicotianae TaxID=4792 RepID=W2QFS3_PHYN3|nr:hypothetical protein PPTG_09436 [Phytophthora nicotianae INRA-310]ETI51381.1 hypothetical protein F443_05245 [Phytophthora nicotianae P1569]ETK91272.1 hypothetical protein L915_05108 [Phytophthora nicotianae]ETP21146.1 hypothetical protein F441_05248 [Phytophthora nicotianae CJ01A1]ETP49088.1 hypothetical protein F442_05295 [Phytophthora nicotianae P10297]ETL44676.1 hypothetical protein L916_05062 [Phytophthora nicotianae]
MYMYLHHISLRNEGHSTHLYSIPYFTTQSRICATMTKRVVNPAFIIMVSVPIAMVLNVFISMNKPSRVVPQSVDLTGDHAYYRPGGTEVSGFKDSTSTYHRSPCPALNALANHGFLPRDGKEITPIHLQQALVQVYNLDNPLAEFLVSSLPAEFSLADLGEHNVVEHDASLVHDDSWKGQDPSSVNVTLAINLLSRGHQLTKTTLAVYRHEREADSTAHTPDFKTTFTMERALTAYSEAAVMLLVLGNSSSIPTDYARAFLVEERIPGDYKKPSVPISLSQSLWLALQLKTLALLSPVLA